MAESSITADRTEKSTCCQAGIVIRNGAARCSHPNCGKAVKRRVRLAEGGTTTPSGNVLQTVRFAAG